MTTTLRLDPIALRVLAHPLRSRLLANLRTRGPATATALARMLGTNTGATSYHLRRLASVGLVEETDGGRGRERPWRASTESHGWTESEVTYDPDAKAASDWLKRYHLREFVDRYAGWLDAMDSWPIEWRDVADASDVLLTVTPADLARFEGELFALFERYRDPSPGDPAARQIQVVVHALPIDPAAP
jgi:DNA-binding transcriptional ArsR family regulator